MRKRMSSAHVKEVLEFMAGEEGGRRAEWIGGGWNSCWVFWRRPEEWAEIVAGWVSRQNLREGGYYLGREK